LTLSNISAVTAGFTNHGVWSGYHLILNPTEKGED